MSLQAGDAIATHNFGLQIDGVTVEYLAEISGLTYEQDVIEYQQVTDKGKPITRKMPGSKKAGECTVTRGMTQSKAFTEWIDKSMKGDMSSARKNASIILQDYQGKETKRYDLRNAWCSKIESAGTKAGDTSPMTEAVTIVYEELEIS